MSSQNIDLVDRLVPSPLHTVVVENNENASSLKKGDLILVDTTRTPSDSAIDAMLAALQISGAAYCVIHFL